MPADQSEAEKDTPKPAEPQDNLTITQHTVTLGGQTIRYTVTTGTIVLREEAEARASRPARARATSPRPRSSSWPTRATT